MREGVRIFLKRVSEAAERSGVAVTLECSLAKGLGGLLTEEQPSSFIDLVRETMSVDNIPNVDGVLREAAMTSTSIDADSNQVWMITMGP